MTPTQDGFALGWSVVAPDGKEVWLEGEADAPGQAYVSGLRLRVLGLNSETLSIPLCTITRDPNRDGVIVTPDQAAIDAYIKANAPSGQA